MCRQHWLFISLIVCYKWNCKQNYLVHASFLCLVYCNAFCLLRNGTNLLHRGNGFFVSRVLAASIQIIFLSVVWVCEKPRNSPVFWVVLWVRWLVASHSARRLRFDLMHSERDFWFRNWHWERVFSNYFGVPLSLSFHRRFICHRRCMYPSVASVIQYHIYLTQIQTVSGFRTNTIFSIFKCYNYVTLTMISCSK